MSSSQRTLAPEQAGHHLRHAGSPDADAVAAVLCASLPALSLSSVHQSATVTCLDTFDWRLLRAKLVLEHARRGAEATLALRELGAPARRLARAATTPPTDAADVDGAFLRQRLDGLADGRALLPVARVRRHETAFGLRDADGKLRLRAALREERAGRARVARYLLLEAVTGYATEARRAMRALRAAGWTAAADPFTEAALACGSVPLDYPTPPCVSLDPAMPALAAVQATALRLLEQMEANRPGMRANLDSEFLHEFRVALRRTRALIGEVPAVLPRPVLHRFKREFRWLGGLSGPARDGDVQLAEIGVLVGRMSAEQAAAMAPFQAWLAEQREVARAELVRAIDGARYRRLVHDWRSRLQRPVPARSRLANASRPVAEVADECIRHAYRRVLRKGRRISDASPPAHLHELRKDAKKLRYLIESFRPLYQRRAVEVLVRDLKALQDNLGEYQDVEVQRLLMEGFAPRVPEATAALLAQSSERLSRREARVRAEFAGRFGAFASRGVRRHLESMLGDVNGVAAA